MQNRNLPILHHLDLLNSALWGIPCFSLATAYVINYGTKSHHTYSIPLISDVASFYPEYRIMSVGLCITALLCFFLCVIRDLVKLILAQQKNRASSKRFIVARVLANIFLIFGILGMVLFGLITDRKHESLICIVIHMFFIGFLLSFVLNDILSSYLGHKPRIITRILTWIISVSVLIFLILRYYVPGKENDKSSMAAFFEIIAYMCIFIKLGLSYYDLPEHVIRLTRRSI